MTPGELTNRQMGKKNERRWRAADTVPLPEHLGERGVAVIRPGGRRAAGEGEGGERKRG